MSESRWSERSVSGADYDRNWDGIDNPHGEADLVASFEPASVLDAGCGTGRVAIELADRGLDVVGVDLDEPMLAEARAKAPDLTWVRSDLSALDLGDRRFDVAVMAGNVMIFVASGTEAAVVARVASHLCDGGVLVAGFQLRPGGYGVADYDAHCSAAGLERVDRFATWDRAPYDGGDYAVSVHRRA